MTKGIIETFNKLTHKIELKINIVWESVSMHR